MSSCGECDYCNEKMYCERLLGYMRYDSPICEYFIKRRKNNGGD